MHPLRIVAVIAAAGAVLVGCGSPAESPAPSSPSPTQPTESHGSYASCLDRHGVPAPPGPVSGPPPGIDAATWESAMAECSELAPGPAG